MATQASDASALPALPNPEPTDSEQVLRCLETARRLWDEGQLREAVRTLQRGAEAAEEDGNDLRALSLARCAADLSAHAGSAPSVAPPASVGEPDIIVISPPAPVPAEALSPASSSTVEAPPESESSSHSPAAVPHASASPSAPLASASPSGQPTAAHASGASNAAQGSATPAAPSVRSVPSQAAAARRVSQPAASSSRRLTPSSEAASSATSSHAARSSSTNGAHAPSPSPPLGREVRVSVRRSNVDQELYVVRPLRPGAKLPYGAQEAVLVFRDAEPESSGEPAGKDTDVKS